MNKKILIILLMINTAVFAQLKNEPDGFRGIKWGTNLSASKEFYKLGESGDNKSYYNENEKMKIGDIDIERITYESNKDRLWFVTIEAKGITNYHELRKIFNSQYGNSTTSSSDSCGWHFNKVLILMFFSHRYNSITVIYKYISIQNEIDNAKAKKGGGDL